MVDTNYTPRWVWEKSGTVGRYLIGTIELAEIAILLSGNWEVTHSGTEGHIAPTRDGAIRLCEAHAKKVLGEGGKNG